VPLRLQSLVLSNGGTLLPLQTPTRHGRLLLPLRKPETTESAGDPTILLPVPDYHSAAIDASLRFIPSPKKLIVLSSSNGLLLCATLNHSSYPSSSSDIYVCNPATRSWTLIPNVARSSHDSLILAFDPEISPHFTLVLVKWRTIQRMPIIVESDGFELETFSSRTNTWVNSQVPRELGCGIHFPKCHVYLNGNVHFLSYNGIVVIHLESKVCHKIEMPFPAATRTYGVLGMSCGSLLYAVRAKREMQVWMLTDYEKHKWVMRKRVVFEFFNLFSRFDVFAFHPDADIVFLKVGRRKELVSYNWINGRMKLVCSLRNNMSKPCLLVFSSYLGEDALEHKNCA
ncbi:hypothetical protein J5N97_000387, partial [Dioscorea zingiberensis]